MQRGIRSRPVEAVQEDAEVVETPEPGIDRRDIVGALGLASFCVGVGAIFWPAGLIALGICLFAVAWFS